MKYYCSFIVLFFISISFLDVGTGKNGTKKQSTLGFKNTKFDPRGLCQSIFTDDRTQSFAAFQANTKNEPGILREIAFKAMAFRSVADNIQYRVNLYSVDHESKLPGELLVWFHGSLGNLKSLELT